MDSNYILPPNGQIQKYVNQGYYNPCPAELFASIFPSFEADTMTKMTKMTKNINICEKQTSREGRGAMVGAWRFANVAACRAVSNPAWCRIFREISCFSPLIIGTLLRCCVLEQGTSSSHASLYSGDNENLVRERWQCVQLVTPIWLHCCML